MQPYTLAASPLDGRLWRETTVQASGAVVLAGFAASAIFVASATAVGVSSGLGHALLVVALLAPGLALQEFWRVAAYSASRARTAAANDACWAAGQIVAFGCLLWIGNVTPAGCLFAWGFGACLGAVLGVVQLAVVPTLRRTALRWARDWFRVGAWFTAVTVTFAIGTFGVALLVNANTGTTGVGLFRTVQNLFGPIQLLPIAAESIYLPHLVRAIKTTRANGVAASRRYSAVMAALVAAYGIFMLLVARSLLTRGFGAEFASATVLVWPMLISFTLDAGASGAALVLRARAQGSRLLVAQVIATTSRLAAVAVLVGIAQLRGAVWGLVVGSAVGAVALWTQVALTSGPYSRNNVPAIDQRPREFDLAATE